MKWLLLLLLLVPALANADAFRNLGFEEADLSKVTPFPSPRNPNAAFGAAAELVPGWQLVQPGAPVAIVGYDLTDTLMNNYASLLTAQSTVSGVPTSGITGNYGFYSLFQGAPFSLSQSGDIPSDAKELRYDYVEMGFEVSVNGLRLEPSNGPLIRSERQQREAVFDISRFAGQTVSLTLTENGISGSMSGDIGVCLIDNIHFVVPEPGTWSLLITGVGCLPVPAARRQLRA